MGKFYKDLKSGLEEILEYKKGKLKLNSEIIEVPEAPVEYKAKDVKKIRETAKYTQDYFAKILNISTQTVRSWESGKSRPSHTALRLLEIIEKGIYRP